MIRHRIALLVTDNSLKANNPWPDSIAWIGQIFLLIFLVMIIALLAYLTTRLLGTARLTRKGGNIRVVESIAVGYQSSVQLVQAGEKYVLIGVTKDKISFLTEVDKDALQIEDPPAISQISFEQIINKYIQRGKTDKERD